MIDSFARLFPTWYRLPPRERGYQQHVIVNWLEIEIEPDAPRRMPTLNELRSWRNREVYYFIADGWDWTKRLFETGQYFPTTEDAPEQFRPARKQPVSHARNSRQSRHVPLVKPAYLSAPFPLPSSQQPHDDGTDDQTSRAPGRNPRCP
jgi:hypothetical protein